MPSILRSSCLIAIIAATAATTPAARSQGVQVRIFFDGGNAFVQSLTVPNQVTVGAIASQTPPGEYNSHSMHLMVDDGDVNPTSMLRRSRPYR